MESIYYYYTIDAKDINRTFTIEFTAPVSDDHEEVVSKTMKIAESAFSTLSKELAAIKKQISQYANETRDAIKKRPNLLQGEYLELIDHVVSYEEHENNRFKENSNIREISKLSQHLINDPVPVLEYTDSSGSWKYVTPFGVRNLEDTILLQIFDQKIKKSICSLEVDYKTFTLQFPTKASTFRVISFEKFLEG